MFEGVAHIVGASFERAPWGWALLALFVTAFVKLRPVMTKLAMDREATLNARVEALERKVDQASASAHAAEMKLVYAVSAVQLLAARIRADNPQDPTLAQAMELLAAATGGGMPGFGVKLARGLNDIKGVGE